MRPTPTTTLDTSRMDMTPRYAPDHVIIARRMKLFPVTRYISHPPGAHAGSAIKPEYCALELVTEAGSRWYGCARAYINAELRMVVVGTDSRDEVRMRWERVPAELQ